MAEALSRCATCKRLHKPHCLKVGDRITFSDPALSGLYEIAGQLVGVEGGGVGLRTGVNAPGSVNDTVLTRKDRHKAGYMAAYMREYRKRAK